LISHRVENPKNRIVCLVLRKTEQSYEEYLTPKRGTKCGVQFLSILLYIVAWLYEGGIINKVRCTRQDVVKIELSRAYGKFLGSKWSEHENRKSEIRKSENYKSIIY
jgi:hypothetical protein